jgi:hypothetical protein
MKGVFIFLGVLTIALAVLTPLPQALFFLYMFRDSCDDVTPVPLVNARGDVAEERVQICSGIGIVVNYSVTLQPRGAKAMQTIVEYSPSDDVHDVPKLYWFDDDTLGVHLGKVSAVWGQIDKLGSIHITYSYSKAE